MRFIIHVDESSLYVWNVILVNAQKCWISTSLLFVSILSLTLKCELRLRLKYDFDLIFETHFKARYFIIKVLKIYCFVTSYEHKQMILFFSEISDSQLPTDSFLSAPTISALTSRTRKVFSSYFSLLPKYLSKCCGET